MIFFNAFQIVVLFACMPLIISYLDTANFTGSKFAYYLAWIIYIFLFIFQIFWTADGLERTRKNNNL